MIGRLFQWRKLVLLFLLLIAKGYAELEVKCPPYYVLKGGTTSCYLFSQGIRSWYDAKYYCERESGRLAKISSADMTAWLSDQIVEQGLVGDSSNFWIDARYDTNTSTWIWDSSGTAVNDDYITIENNRDGDFGSLTTDSTLRGKSSSDMYHFICYRDINVPNNCNFVNGWHVSNDKCYNSPNISTSFSNSVIECDKMDSTIMTVNGLQEQLYAYDEAIRHQDNIWIGLNELGHPGTWTWISGQDPSYSNWDNSSGMPISQGGYGAAVIDEEDSEGHWITESVSNNHHFLCEKPKGGCVTGWEQNEDSCYYFSRGDLVTFESGKQICSDIGAQLVVIETEEEDDFISSHVDPNFYFWIGLSHEQGSSSFMWVDGTPYNSSEFTKMTASNEDEALTASGDRRDSIHLLSAGTSTEDSDWYPVVCSDVHNYICEAPKDTPLNLTIVPTVQYCHSGWELKNDYCYFFSQVEKSWSQSENYCKTYGGHLASVLSYPENDYIRNSLQTTSWFGLNDRDEEGMYLFSDNNPLVIDQWSPNEPTGGEENCVEFYTGNGLWNDLPCSDLLTFICKAPYSSTPLDTVSTTSEPPFTSSCGDGWQENLKKDTCYKVETMKLSFTDAQIHCSELPYSLDQTQPTLVSFSNIIEQNFIESLIQDMVFEENNIFIGLTNTQNEGLRWLDSTVVSYFDFKDGFLAQDCIVLDIESGYHWNGISCSSRMPFICEKKQTDYVTPTPPGPTLCPEGWQLFNNHCYYVYSDGGYGYDEATDFCASYYGSSLASIDSEDENMFLFDQIDGGDYSMWIGLHKNSGENETYQWTDGSLLGYTNWYPGEPSYSGSSEFCVKMYHLFDEGQWIDTSCSDNYFKFACKTTYKTCPENWELWNAKCYHISEETQTWDISEEKCKEVEGEATLVSWHSQEEVSYVMNMIDSSISNTWIGLHQNQSSLEWEWTDGTDLDYPNWNTGQPQNNSEFCGAANADGTVNDYPCDDSYNYACEFYPTHTIGCEDDWQYYDGLCYYFSGTGHDSHSSYHDEAVTECEDMDAVLASIHSRELNSFLGSLLHESSSSLLQAWIGLEETDKSGELKWLNEDKIVYTNFGLYTPTTYQCFVMMDPNEDGSYQWKEKSCDGFTAFMFCQKPQTVTSLLPPENGCLLDTDLTHGTSCYTPVTTFMQYEDALANCSSLVDGSHLVTMMNAHESAYLSAYYETLGVMSWIGLKESFTDEGAAEFKWIDGTPFTFDAWGEYEPVSDKGLCVAASGEPEKAGLWYVSSCNDNNFPFFCEYPRTGFTTAAYPPTTEGPDYCAAGWSHYSITKSCYKLKTNEGLTQALAEEDCSQYYYGHLVSITDELEEHFILGMNDVKQLNSTYFWTGLVLGENGYQWLDYSAVGYLNWAPNQPDNQNYREDCVFANKDNLQISDAYCDGIYPYMCKANEGMSEVTYPSVTKTPDVPCSVDSLASDGWLEHNDNCYRVYAQEDISAMSWSSASNFCRSKGSELASVLDNSENSFILSKIYSYSDDMFWLGASADLDRQFTWSDGSPFVFINWRNGEPNNYNDQESCIITYSHDQALWNDVNCGRLLGFICKRPVSNTVPPRQTTASSTGHCGEGWIHAGDKCIQINTEQKTFDEARTKCKSSGVNADLVSIHGPEMQAAVSAALAIHDSNAWIGLRWNDKFYWVDESEVQYTNWGTGEPNGQDEEQNCGLMLHHDGSWDDFECYSNSSSVCMQNIDPSVSSHRPPTCTTPNFETYTNYSGDCYFVVNDPKTWQEAKEYCESIGSNLVSIEGIIDNNFVYAYAVDSYLTDVWTGLNSLQNKEQYTWVNSFPVLYTNWGDNQPNVNNTDGRCVELKTGKDGTWFNSDCNQKKSSMCKHYEGQLPSASPAVDGSCPDSNWLNFGYGYCYIIETKVKKSWNDANLACIQAGGYLVSIHSEEEMNLLKKATESYAYSLWSGLVQRMTDYGWSDGTAIDFFYWADSEPNGQAEECVEMYPDSRKWNDNECSAKYGYVCKAATVGGNQGQLTTQSSNNPSNPDDGSTFGLGGGAIAAIVIVCLVIISAVGFLGYSNREKIENQFDNLKSKISQPKTQSTSSAGYDNDSFPKEDPGESQSVLDIEGNDFSNKGSKL